MRCFFKFIRLSRAFVLMERVGYAKIKRCIEKTIWGRKYIIFLLFVVIFVDMQELRAVADELETMVGEEYWAYPTYGKLLFGVN